MLFYSLPVCPPTVPHPIPPLLSPRGPMTPTPGTPQFTTDPPSSTFHTDHWGLWVSQELGTLPLRLDQAVFCYVCARGPWTSLCMLPGWWLRLWKLPGVQVSRDCWSSYGVALLFSFFNAFPDSTIGVSGKWIWRFLRTGSIWRSSYSTLGHIPKRCPTTPQGHMLHHVHTSLIYSSQKLETTQISLKQRNEFRKRTFIQWNSTELLKTMTSGNSQ